jgi:hypothetical protein
MPPHSHAHARRNGRVAVAIIINLCFTVSNHANNHSFWGSSSPSSQPLPHSNEPEPTPRSAVGLSQQNVNKILTTFFEDKKVVKNYSLMDIHTSTLPSATTWSTNCFSSAYKVATENQRIKMIF